MCGEDVVGLASENEVERRAHRLAHDLTHLLVPIVHRPATVREAAAVVLSRSARGLHDPVKGQEGAHDQLSHLSSFFGFDRHACQYTVRPGAVASSERWSGGVEYRNPCQSCSVILGDSGADGRTSEQADESGPLADSGPLPFVQDLALPPSTHLGE